MPRYLIVGGAGFMGSNLAALLLAEGHRVRVLDRPGAVSPLPALQVRDIEWREGDFTRSDEASAALSGVDAVFHLAGNSLPAESNRDPARDIETNLLGTVRLAEEAARAKVRRFVFASSGGAVYGRATAALIGEDHAKEPLSAYGITKLAAEKYLQIIHRERGLDPVCLRIANPYGPYQRSGAAQGAVAVFVGRALAGKPIEVWGDGSVVRDFIAVEDVCRAMVAAAQAAGPQVFNVGSGEGKSINQVIETIAHVLGRALIVSRTPGRPTDAPVNVLDISRIRQKLGWRPLVSFEEGVAKYIQRMQTASVGDA